MLPLQPINDNLELLARQAVEGYIIGLHKSPFHGFSVEFAEHRIYNQGDALRHIDWRVFGRTDKLFVKRFEEETNLRCSIAIDTSSSMQFANSKTGLSKLHYAVYLAACLLQLLKRQMDATSLALFDDRIHYFSECRSAPSHFRLLTAKLEQTLHATSQKQTTQIAQALHEIAEKMHRRSLVIIFSDMMDSPEAMEPLFSALQHLKYNKHEVLLFHLVEGSQELRFEYENRPYEFVDMETGEKYKLQPQSIKEAYVTQMKSFLEIIENRCHQYKIDYVAVDLETPVEQVLSQYLLKRSKMQ